MSVQGCRSIVLAFAALLCVAAAAAAQPARPVTAPDASVNAPPSVSEQPGTGEPKTVHAHEAHQPPPGQKPAEAGQKQKPPQPAEDDHAGHQHHAPAAHPAIPPVTDADRAAAFPDVHGHTLHGSPIHYFVLFDQAEWQGGSGGAFALHTKGWVGGDLNRVWFRADGEVEGRRVHGAAAHVLYGRAVSRWWDLVAGVRQDVRPGPTQTWAAIGVQGLAPYWFEVEATAYVGASGRTHLHVATEYELLFTNRLILQPLVALDLYGKPDPARGLAAGLSTVDAGLRMRYEVRREFAPYIGVVWQRKYFGTADLAREHGERTSGARVAAGVRVWF